MHTRKPLAQKRRTSIAFIVGNITIGDIVIIGAGSVVVKDIPKGAVVAGNSAKIIRIT